MPESSRHFVILPYFCEEEVGRYLKIGERLKTFPEPRQGYHFLLASSPKTKTSKTLVDYFSKIGNTIPFACPTQIFGYPQGPTAMFWDCMDFLASNFSGERGFGLWLESDMVPVQPDWIDRLSDGWFGRDTEAEKKTATNETPIMMGCYVPQVFKHRVFKRKKLILHEHINGGACYAMDFARLMPASAREGVFDMAVYRYAKNLGRVKATNLISFSTLSRARRDLFDRNKVLLHGFMQEKNEFVKRCCDPITEQEQKGVVWHSWMDHLEYLKRKVKVQFVRRGPQAMLENMFLAKRNFELSQSDDGTLLRKSA